MDLCYFMKCLRIHTKKKSLIAYANFVAGVHMKLYSGHFEVMKFYV